MKQQEIQRLLEDLYAIDPSLRSHEAELPRILATFQDLRPDTKFDPRFAEQLRAQLTRRSVPVSRPINWLTAFSMKKMSFAIAGSALVLVLAVAAVYYGSGPKKAPRRLASLDLGQGQQVKMLEERAFGDLLAQGQNGALTPEAAGTPAGFGGGGPSTSSGSSSGAAVAPGLATMAADARLSAPMPISPEIYPYPYDRFRFVYAGDPVGEMPSRMTVYRRSVQGIATGALTQAMRSLTIGPLSLGSFANTEVRNINFAENGKRGFNVFVDFMFGTVNMYRDPAYIARQEPYQPLQPQDMLAADEIISIAERFVRDRGISLENYGDPDISDQTYFIALKARAGEAGLMMPDYLPDVVSVVYPLRIDEQAVYDQGGSKDGLFIAVDIRGREVTSVSNLAVQQYDGSQYNVETDIETLVARYNEQYNYMPEGAAINDIMVELGSPELGLTKIYIYQDATGQELFIPAYIFPVTRKPENQPYYPNVIVMPLATDLIDRPQPLPMPLIEGVPDSTTVAPAQ
ncbi:MAG: hypothetical protein AAB490_00120 [Patescibacteria group bacterium]